MTEQISLLGASEIRALANELDLRPSKSLGQNFVIDANVCRKIVRLADVQINDEVVEIGPGLGSLTLALLKAGARVTAVEIDSRLASRLAQTAQEHGVTTGLELVCEDALSVSQLPTSPKKLVANLPYNVSVPVLLHFLESFPSIESGIVMVQHEVAERLAAEPGTKSYGAPSVKAAWWCDVDLADVVSRTIFWPVPNVDSALVRFKRHDAPGSEVLRKRTFQLIDGAFGQRRKMLRSALAARFGSSTLAETALEKAGINPTDRGESLTIDDFVRLAATLG